MIDCNEGRGANVVPFGKDKSQMRHHMIQEVRAYWEALREDGQIPLRSRVDPRGIERALEHAFVLERVAPGLARFRVAGMHLNELMGMEVRGMPLSAFFLPEAREMLAPLVEGTFSAPQISELGLRSPARIGCPEMEGAMILLPLRNDKGEITRALGSLVMAGDMGRAPRRLTIAEARTIPLPGVPQPERGVEEFLSPIPQPGGGFAEAPTTFRPARRGHLRLVKTDT